MSVLIFASIAVIAVVIIAMILGFIFAFAQGLRMFRK